MEDTNTRQQPRSKKGGGKGKSSSAADEDVTLTQALIANQKLSLANASTIRSLCASVWDFRLLPKESKAAQAAMQANSEYFTKVQEAGAGHGLGEPHIQVAHAMILELAKQTDIPEMYQGILNIQAVLPQVLTPSAYDEIIPYFTIAEGYAAEEKNKPYKVTFMVQPLAVNCMEKADIKNQVFAIHQFSDDLMKAYSPGSLREAILCALDKQGAKTMIGRAPRGPLERIVQKHLKSLQRQ